MHTRKASPWQRSQWDAVSRLGSQANQPPDPSQVPINPSQVSLQRIPEDPSTLKRVGLAEEKDRGDSLSTWRKSAPPSRLHPVEHFRRKREGEKMEMNPSSTNLTNKG
jgi:hypothetical protein